MTYAAERSILKNERGMALLIVVVVIGALLLGGTALLQSSRNELIQVAHQSSRSEAFYVAEAGVQHALTQLRNDRAAANASTSYTYASQASPATASFGPGSYGFWILSDPIVPERKIIHSRGTVQGIGSKIVAYALVQPGGGGSTSVCDTFLSSNAGDARLIGAAAVGVPLGTVNLFNGEIFSNPGRDVRFSSLVDLGLDAPASSEVRSGRDFWSNTATVSKLKAKLYYAGSYRKGGLEGTHTHLLPSSATLLGGYHFNDVNNALAGHGQQEAAVSRRFPRPDYATLARDPRTVLVNADTVGSGAVPGTWSSGTWTYSGELIFGSFGLDPNVVYYVEGNAKLETLYLAADASATVVARGWMTVENVGLVGIGGFCVGRTVMPGPAGAGASLCAQVTSGTTQSFHLIAENDLVIGYETIDILTSAATENAFLSAGVSVGAGLGTSVAGVGTHNRIMAYSEKGGVWVLTSTVNALADTDVNICAQGNATLTYTAGIETTMGTYDPVVF